MRIKILGIVMALAAVAIQAQKDGDPMNFVGKTVAVFPLYEVAKQLKGAPEGTSVTFTADSAQYLETDIRSWCELTGNVLVSAVPGQGGTVFTVAKGKPSPVKKFSLVLSSDGLLEAVSPLGFALAAAESGMEVSLYLQGPGVHLLKRGYEAKISDPLSSLFSGFARNGLNKIGHLPPQDKLKQMQELGAKIYACGPSLDNFGVKESEFFLEGITVCEYFTFLLRMREADVQIYQ